MRKVLFCAAMCMIALSGFAQKEVVLKSGTIIPLKSSNTIAAADVKVGDKVSFRVSREITVDGSTVIPYGTMASGRVSLAKKSSWWGTKGRLTIDINELAMSDGTTIPLENGTVKIQGKNRTTLSVILFCLVTILACFITGSKAEMQAGYEIQTNVAKDTKIKVQ